MKLAVILLCAFLAAELHYAPGRRNINHVVTVRIYPVMLSVCVVYLQLERRFKITKHGREGDSLQIPKATIFRFSQLLSKCCDFSFDRLNPL